MNNKEIDTNIEQEYKEIIEKNRNIILNKKVESKQKKVQKENKKARKQKLIQMKYNFYKPIVPYPLLLDFEDVTYKDPIYLNYIKGLENTVPVPKYWKNKKSFLNVKKCINKKKYVIPQNILETGLVDMRKSIRNKEDNMSFKAKLREKLYPKTGKCFVEYQKLYDCFFKHPNEIEYLRFGELFRPGIEMEKKIKLNVPGRISKNLMNVLGIDKTLPPPWIFNMQKYGPPPSYSDIKIPGVNAQIPIGSSWGFQPTGWGQPLEGYEELMNINFTIPSNIFEETNNTDQDLNNEETISDTQQNDSESEEQYELRMSDFETDSISEPKVEEIKPLEITKDLISTKEEKKEPMISKKTKSKSERKIKF
ncbi:subunit 2 of splicing factor 3b [Hamiltosporidium magnivora]|uniref:Subunit 2 of splicing factor 3b n=1 Tax=Hamiltosporidium magnivora TaxID=148818 RepID=A0A4Q9LKL7_9MICR|nr:subunit 2 of splicing factor 3b [Hamiltosporidium magnivora]